MPIVFSRPNCVQCTATYRALDRAGIEYETVNVAEDEASAQRVKDLGYMAAPVVFVSDENHWAGFNPGKIQELANA